MSFRRPEDAGQYSLVQSLIAMIEYPIYYLMVSFLDNMKIPTIRCSLAVNKSLIKSLTESWKPIVNGAGITFIVQVINKNP